MQKSRLTPYKNHTYIPEITSDKQPEAQEQPNLMVALPSQPYMCSSSYSQAKMPPRSTKIFSQHVATVYCRERKSFPMMNEKISRSKPHNCTFALENTSYIVWFK